MKKIPTKQYVSEERINRYLEEMKARKQNVQDLILELEGIEK